jgi:hypothetical protein
LPAQQLFDRLGERASDTPWRLQVLPGQANWPAHLGANIADPRAMVVHETSGWATRGNGENMFLRAFLPGAGHPHTGETTQLYVSGDGTVLLGMELPRETWHATFVNDWAFGSETGHGWGNYAGNDHLGPATSTDETMVSAPNPHPPPATILVRGPTFGDPIPLRAKPGNRWLPLSGNANMAAAADDDLPGVKMWVRHQSFDEVLVAWWTTARYTGPWRQEQRVPEMLFSDAQYRAWALLARYVAERWLLPRNVALLPHKMRVAGNGVNTALHGLLRDDASFAAMVLADEGASRSPTTFGLPAAPVPPTDAQLRARYPTGLNAAGNSNRHWTSFFNVYRGFHGHGFSGDPRRRRDHDCPGPMFDWHRFARELWDWWWHPFDFDPATPNASVAPRAYSLDTRDADTPLKEHYWSTAVTVPQGREVAGIHGPTGSPQTFELPSGSRIYAMANGELVAARFPAETGGVNLAFLVVRHEVFHQLDGRAAAAAPPGGLPVFANRIDYDVALSTVFTLYLHLGRPPGMRFDQVDAGNPDWLNRMLMRSKECDLGTTFRLSAAGQAIPNAKWNDRPPGSAPRPTLLEAWTTDLAHYRTALQRLGNGDIMFASRDLMGTPIRILLGDFLGNAGIIRRDAATTKRGVRVEIFSRDILSATEFNLTVTDAARRWDPLMDPFDRPSAVRYPSEWSRRPDAAERQRLQALGVDDPDQVFWWEDAQAETALNPRYPADARLDPGGIAVHYDPYEFLPWLNRRTWRSEWPKYRAVDPAPGGIPDHPIPRA